MIRSDEMMSKGRKLFRLSCIITAIGVFISVCSFVDGTFWRGFGENELVILLIFLAATHNRFVDCRPINVVSIR